jgi:ABC-type sulfate transport system permease component
MTNPESPKKYEAPVHGWGHYIFGGLAVLVCAVPGSMLAWWLVSLLGLGRVAQALLTIPVAMVFSVGLFAGLTVLGRLLGFNK